MKYRKIRKMDIADGPGVRVSIFFQGCDFHGIVEKSLMMK